MSKQASATWQRDIDGPLNVRRREQPQVNDRMHHAAQNSNMSAVVQGVSLGGAGIIQKGMQGTFGRAEMSPHSTST
jgi:hypothetical protein